MTMTEGRGLTAKSRCGIHGDLTGDTGRCPRCDQARGLRECERFVRSVARSLLEGGDGAVSRQRRRVQIGRPATLDPTTRDALAEVLAALDDPMWTEKRRRIIAVADDLGRRADAIERP